MLELTEKVSVENKNKKYYNVFMSRYTPNLVLVPFGFLPLFLHDQKYISSINLKWRSIGNFMLVSPHPKIKTLIKYTIFFPFFQNKAAFPLVRKDYYIESIRRLIHTSGRLPPIKSKKMSPLTLPCGLT